MLNQTKHEKDSNFLDRNYKLISEFTKQNEKETRIMEQLLKEESRKIYYFVE